MPFSWDISKIFLQPQRSTRVKAVNLWDLWRNKTSSVARTTMRLRSTVLRNESRRGKAASFFASLWLEKETIVAGECCETPVVNHQFSPLCKHWNAWGISLIHGLRKWGWEITEWLHKRVKRPRWNSGSSLNKDGWLVVLFEAGVWSEVLQTKLGWRVQNKSPPVLEGLPSKGGTGTLKKNKKLTSSQSASLLTKYSSDVKYGHTLPQRKTRHIRALGWKTDSATLSQPFNLFSHPDQPVGQAVRAYTMQLKPCSNPQDLKC